MFSLYCAMKARGEARILAFEPIPSTHAVLAANAAAANGGKFNSVFQPSAAAAAVPGALRIQAFNVGLSDAPASVVFEHHPRLTIWSTGDSSFAEARRDRFVHDVTQAFA